MLIAQSEEVAQAIKTVTEGSRVTTRYYGGYEAVIVRQIHKGYFVVVRFGGTAKNLDGGEGTDILPKDQVEKITRFGPAQDVGRYV
jgi:hypothetical protein